MKWLCLALLVANGLFFAFTNLEAPPPLVDWRSREVSAEQLKQIAFKPASEVSDVASSAPPAPDANPALAPDGEAASTAPAPAPAAHDAATAPTESAAKPAAAPAQTASPANPPAKEALTCFAWRGILPADLPNVRKKLAGLNLGGEIRPEIAASDSPTRFWVYIPPRASLAEAQKKADELKALGISDFFVVNDGSEWRNAVSLGLFSAREGAERRLSDLRNQGVRSAQLRERGGEADSRALMIRQVPKSARLALGRAAMGFRGSTVSETGC